ncbi:hypothetical protein PMAYCL1PPCAC_31792 [Pristionchus mayeri]|uniref:Uncharacterized protein n=1 Tax=Pristionchus mayeri TaxID=1317129 RepID=A0AAN5DGF0_9BILA|nr:hypothetical protein PMAYCL1PPCAC_31792 [Pristionchus mayeri]
MEGVFELRIKHHESSFEMKKLEKRIIDYIDGGLPKTEIGYIFECNSLNSNEMDNGIKRLGECMGHHIGNLELCLGKPWNEVNVLNNLLGGIKVENLDLRMDNISTTFVNQLISMTKTQQIDEIHLDVRGGDESIDTVDMLVELSKHVLRMIVTPWSQYFFDVIDREWGPIVLKMFSNKLDTLKICLCNEPPISKYSADFLREQLPLMGKKIWYLSSCKENYVNALDYTSHDHWVRALGRTLLIRHLSRRDEGR